MNESPKITVVFPMAGRGARFGSTFKPFLRVGDETFIEAAVRPFRKWMPAIRQFVFVYLEEQEAEFSVAARLTTMFGDLPTATVLLERPTAGPAETLASGAARAGIVGEAIVCDCDHAINVDPLFKLLVDAMERVECVIPVWDLASEDPKSWSIAAVGTDGRVTAIAEKRPPDGTGTMLGVIGCYYFHDVRRIADLSADLALVHISDVIGQLLAEGRQVAAVRIQEAEFFGDPRRLENALRGRTVRVTESDQPSGKLNYPKN